MNPPKEILTIVYDKEEYTLKEFHEKGYEADFWTAYKRIAHKKAEDDGTYKIQYKNEILTINDIIKREEARISKLALPRRIGSLHTRTAQLVCYCCNNKQIHRDIPEYYETLKLFDVLSNRMSSARYALLNGIYILHQSETMWWINGSQAQLWLRTEFLNNAIIWYNNSFDVLLQIPWIGHKIYKDYTIKNIKYDLRQIQHAEEYDKILAHCNWARIKNWQEKKGELNDYWTALQEFHYSEIYQQVNDWANKLKHRNGIFYEETYEETPVNVTLDNYHPLKLTPELLPMDYVIDTLVEYHVTMLELIEQIRIHSKTDKLYKE